MALATTTLTSAATATDQNIVVASAASIAPGRLIQIDQESMQVTQSYVIAALTVPVLRGRDGSVAAAHVVTSNVTHGLASDFSTPVGQTVTTYPVVRGVVVRSITATSSLVLPQGYNDIRIGLNGTSVITLTIPVPTKDMDYCRLTVIPNGAAAHVLSFTGGLGGGGANFVKFSLQGTVPVAFEAIAMNGVWTSVVAIPAAGTVTTMTGTISA